jgi:hypothetical protein
MKKIFLKSLIFFILLWQPNCGGSQEEQMLKGKEKIEEVTQVYMVSETEEKATSAGGCF